MFDDTGKVLEYRPKILPFRMVRGPGDVAGLLELAPHRLDGVDARSEDLTVLFPPSVARQAGFPELSHETD